MMRRRSSISVVSWLHRRRRPPPLRLTRPFGNGVASRSFRPRPMVERASPVILEIASRPPRPAARTSPAANTLRPRSSSFEPTDSHLCRIAFASIMPTRILPGRYFRNPGALSHLATSRQSKNRFICFGSLPNLVLDELDRELERRGHRFVRYADDCNIYVRSERAGQRVMESISRFITQKLKLKVNEAKSAVARPQERKFLGFSFTTGPDIKRTIAPKSLERFKQRIREITRRAKGDSIKTTMEELATYMRGWRGYFGFCETPEVL